MRERMRKRCNRYNGWSWLAYIQLSSVTLQAFPVCGSATILSWLFPILLLLLQLNYFAADGKMSPWASKHPVSDDNAQRIKLVSRWYECQTFAISADAVTEVRILHPWHFRGKIVGRDERSAVSRKRPCSARCRAHERLKRNACSRVSVS
jgi:hypothetical protein